MSGAELENKLGMSLDDLIAQQKKKTPVGKKPLGRKNGPMKVQQRGQQGRTLNTLKQQQGQRQAPRVRGVPATSPGVNRGGIRKQQGAPKFMKRPAPIGRPLPPARGRTVPIPARPRNMKIVIANSRAATQPPSDFLAGSRGKNGTAPMVMDDYRQMAGRAPGPAAPPPGSTLSQRFDKLSGSSSVPTRAPGSGPRRNAHGVLIP